MTPNTLENLAQTYIGKSELKDVLMAHSTAGDLQRSRINMIPNTFGKFSTGLHWEIRVDRSMF